MSIDSSVNAGQAGQPPVFDSYGRLSWNPTTHELEKIETQHEDNRKTIARHGGVLGAELADGLSAWKKNVRRKDFEKLLERAEKGLSQGIAVWHVDRLFRQPRDLERLIDLADSGFMVIGSHGTRDLSNPDDRFILRIEVAHAARSSDDTSRRIKRRFQKYREEGRLVGGRPGFGFMRKDPAWTPGPSQDEDDRPFVSARQVARERSALRAAVKAVEAKLTDQSKVARLWNEMGLRTVAGNTFTPVAVRATLLRPTLCGRIEHEGTLVGRLPGKPIVDEKVWLRMRAQYEGRRRGAAPGRQHLAPGVLVCGVCGTKLSGRKKEKKKKRSDGTRVTTYYCNKDRRGCGEVYADMRAVDTELRLLTISRLSDSRYAQAITAARAQVSERLADVTKEIEEIEALQAALSERLGRREITLGVFDASNKHLMEDLEPLLAEREELSGGSPEGPSVALSAEQVAAQWDGTDDLMKRRAMLVDAIGPMQVQIMPAVKEGKRTFDPDRVKLVQPKPKVRAKASSAA